MLSVSVTYSFADMFGVVAHSWRRLLRFLVIIELLWVVLFIGIDMLNGATFSEGLRWLDWRAFAAGTLFLVALWFVLCPLIAYLRTTRAGLKGPNRFTLVERGLEIGTVKSEAVVYWTAIRRTVQSSSRFYIFLITGGAVIVPRRAFKSPEDFLAFAKVAKQSWSAGRLDQ